MVVAGQGCLYNVWSSLGDLLQFINQLRFVEGLQAEPGVSQGGCSVGSLWIGAVSSGRDNILCDARWSSGPQRMEQGMPV